MTHSQLLRKHLQRSKTALTAYKILNCQLLAQAPGRKGVHSLAMKAVMDVGGPDAGHEEQQLKGQEVHWNEEQKHRIGQRLHPDTHTSVCLLLATACQQVRGSRNALARELQAIATVLHHKQAVDSIVWLGQTPGTVRSDAKHVAALIIVCRRFTSNSCMGLAHLKDAVNRVERKPREGGQRVLLVVLVVYVVQAPAAASNM